ncbi:MAG: hypothetical protein U1E02_04650 [Hydrogenophaga sp.]|jgi:hypothetical protein|uniref:hypothetical protein n=1 Tax=Hydrogenophaga sp. TaxID=1904254 RepID=UPI0027157E4A|nr:hypothetical protein [Hydrogenophaga sp.]MDO8889810.1 hypothetical protein [Hydrogenophaga sp.]MDP2251098.1 hypothetical protein [Hydrogenophaga sp.]MDZ4123456.1 hypothetical protein [Hydrogenophaga sp.]
MRRCLIAIFALHFFLSVSVFAFGDLHGSPSSLAHIGPTAVVSAGPDATPGIDTGKAGSSASHALVDDLPDLPDSLPRVFVAQRPPLDGGLSIGYRQRAALPPSLDGLLRPPQKAALTA